jgi:hypothetical protein
MSTRTKKRFIQYYHILLFAEDFQPLSLYSDCDLCGLRDAYRVAFRELCRFDANITQWIESGIVTADIEQYWDHVTDLMVTLMERLSDEVIVSLLPIIGQVVVEYAKLKKGERINSGFKFDAPSVLFEIAK